MIDPDPVIRFITWPFRKLAELIAWLRRPRRDDQDGDPNDGTDLGPFG